MHNEDRKNFYMNRNVKLLPTHIALTWDVLFVWTISMMFFTEQKGLSYSQTVLLDSILMLLGCVCCLFLSKVFQKVSPLNTSRIANIGYAGYLLLCIFGTNYFTFIVAQFFLAFGYSLRSIKDNLILADSLRLVKRNRDYERVFGKGLSMFYIIEAVGAIAVTYIYDWNAYGAYWLSFAVVVFVTLYSFLIKNPVKFQESNISIDAKQESIKKQVKPDGYFKILASAFFLSLIFFAFMFRGVASVNGSMFKIFLQNMINAEVLPLWSFGYIYAGSRISVAIASKFQFKFSLKFGVRSILIFVLFLTGGYLINGLLYIFLPYNSTSIIVTILLSYILVSLRSPYQIFISNYIQVCMPKKNLERAYAIKTTVEYLGYALMSFTCSGFLTLFNNDYGKVSLAYIGIFIIPLVISMIFFVRLLVKKYAQKYTIIKDEYTKD